ncbi:ligand-binding sensor domain-containing protein [Haliscomenobacter hydrossis]|uniref:Signal transduction histidine kinase n=1 Tax=Haliscomenobacter hydrossis (strain ATCC 27775 / DSM 1100 / LMG 10767 / O) TaxID=760192 RepID=F4KXE4_HALH1|nr:two-component regulator propeller domain-containing protein [Haliscomenobacter hydrossis]AEE49352.1 putative signal transduction histidine kinase [Haliscomenobacter hydrossis DSM 1100]
MKRIACWVLSWVVLTGLWAQKYNFVNLNVEHGLIQSQALALCQDQQGHLWIATMGGVSRYDGQHFTGFSMNDGLANNICLTILSDRKGRIWVGTQNGLSRYDGSRFRNYFFSKKPQQNEVSSLAEDQRGRIWCTVKGKVYCVDQGKIIKADLPKDHDFRQVFADHQGQIWACGPKAPLYTLRKGQWQEIELPTGDKEPHAPFRLYSDPDHNLWLLTRGGVYRRKKGVYEKFNPPGFAEMVKGGVRRLAFDQNKNLWLGTQDGLYQVKPEGIRRFDQSNGFSQNVVTDMLIDREHQLWVSMAGGDGLFRYAGDTFEQYDESTGLPTSSVMSICRDSAQQIWVGTYGGGLARLGKNGFETVRLPHDQAGAQRINSIITDHSGRLWIGTEGLGLWRYQQGKFTQLLSAKDGLPQGVVLNVYEDRKQRIWVGTPAGIMRYDSGRFEQLKAYTFFSSCFLDIGQDSLLVGSTSGILLLQHDRNILRKQPDLLRKSTVICAARQGSKVWIGSDNGLFLWDLNTNVFKHYSQKSGLPSNIVYNLSVSKSGIIYAGTGQGFAQLTFDSNTETYQIDNFSATAGIPNWESNQHATLIDRDGSVWFGTTKGLFRYHPHAPDAPVPPAEVILQSVKLFSKPLEVGQWNKGLSPGYHLPQQLRLPPRKNHLSFEFAAISLRDPQGMQYQYRIQGLDENWSILSNNHKVEYPNLPAGKFVFQARARNKNGRWSQKNLNYNFEIITPFYQTAWFRGGTVGFLVLLGIAIQSFRVRLRSRRKRQMALLRQEEQEKVRRRTAEDFHDELGNKLTRIALLTEILQNKLGPQQPDVKGIVSQIKENAVQLYGGARDIIWALNPSSDNLYEILTRIRDFGVDLFADTGIEFSCEGIQDVYRGVVVPIDYSRNLIMIFKEALNNCLKHSQAQSVTFEVMPNGFQSWRIILRDNGKGFSLNTIKKGHGIDNMQIRAKRIQADLDFAILPIGGTRLELRFSLKTKNVST